MRRRKYANTKTEVDGILFDSKKEASYYIELKHRRLSGEITNLRLQVRYEILPSVKEEEIKQLKTKQKIVERCVQRPTYYVADFVYTNPETGQDVVVDVKSKATHKDKVFRLKKKMMRALLGINVIEV